jgi:hypothetical protein
MPTFLIVLGVLVFGIAVAGIVSVVTESKAWPATTEALILLWLGLAVVVPRQMRRRKDHQER